MSYRAANMRYPEVLANILTKRPNFVIEYRTGT
jgi:hypothetical protein